MCYREPITSVGTEEVLYEGLGLPATHMRFYKDGVPLLPESQDPATGWRELGYFFELGAYILNNTHLS